MERFVNNCRTLWTFATGVIIASLIVSLWINIAFYNDWIVRPHNYCGDILDTMKSVAGKK